MSTPLQAFPRALPAIGRHLPPEATRLLDERTGLITSVTISPNRPEWPESFSWATADVAAITRVADFAADATATGMSFFDPDIARAAAVGEAVERYCGNAVTPHLPRRSYREWICDGQAAVNPADLALYSAQDYATPGFPFVPFSPDLPVLWAPGRDLLSGEPVWVPGSLVWVNWRIGPRADEPATNFVHYSGLATGQSREDAEGSALEELIERDATEIWWRTRGPLAAVTDSELDHALEVGADLDLETYAIPSPFGVPVRIVIARDRRRQLLTVGVAARRDARQAALKAAGEAITLLVLSEGLLDRSTGSVWQAIDLGLLKISQKPWRDDRHYARSYREDYRDLTDLICHSQFYLDPQAQRLAESTLTSMTDAAPLPPEGHSWTQDRRQDYLSLLAAQGLRPVSVDLTTPDVAAAGLRVVRVVVPGLIPNAPAAFPYNGGRRLFTEPVRMGWADHELSLDELSTLPFPHA